MRYVDGPDLGTLLDRDGPLPVTGALGIAAQVASALDAAHDHGLVHRDVKPSGRAVPVGGRGDLYSLACVVYEALAGEPVFQRDDGVALLWAHQYDLPPPLSERHPGLAPAVDSVMAKALAKDPEHRYGSCREFVAELISAAGGRVA